MPTTTIPSGQGTLEWRLERLLTETKGVHNELARLHARMERSAPRVPARGFADSTKQIRDKVAQLLIRIELIQQVVPVAMTLARVYRPDYGSDR